MTGRLLCVVALVGACGAEADPEFVPCELIGSACGGVSEEVAPLVDADRCRAVATAGNEDACSAVIGDCDRECPATFPASLPGNLYGCWLRAGGGGGLCFSAPTDYRATLGATVDGVFEMSDQARPGVVVLHDFPGAGSLACLRVLASTTSLFTSDVHVGDDCTTISDLGPIVRRFDAPVDLF